MGGLRGHLRTNVVGYVAVFIALCGTTYAATQLPKNSIGPRQIRPSAVGTSEARNNAFTGKDINETSLGQVPSAQSAGNAQQAENADTLDDLDSADFLRSTGKAIDADTLDGSDASAFQRRVTGTCGQVRGVTQVLSDGSVNCASRVVLPIAFTPANGLQNAQLEFFDTIDLQIVASCRPTSVRFDNFTGAAATLNWMFSEGTSSATTVNASGNVIANASTLDFAYGGSGRLEGQWIFSATGGVTTVNLHAFQGADSCEVRGTALWAPF
jgi:hypothetical protein